MKIVQGDVMPDEYLEFELNHPSTSADDFYGYTLQHANDNLHKDMPSSSKNINQDLDLKQCAKDAQFTQTLENNAQSKDNYRNNKNSDLNLRRFSENTVRVNLNLPSTSRFTTTLVKEDSLKVSSSDSQPSGSKLLVEGSEAVKPLVTKAKNPQVKPGFTIGDDR